MQQSVTILRLHSANCLHVGHDEVRASPVEAHANNTAGYCLTLPGRKLYLTPLLGMKKFRKRGNKEGALTAFYHIEEDGLGKLLELQGSKGTSTVSYDLCNVYIDINKVQIILNAEHPDYILPRQICRKMSFTFIVIFFITNYISPKITFNNVIIWHATFLLKNPSLETTVSIFN